MPPNRAHGCSVQRIEQAAVAGPRVLIRNAGQKLRPLGGYVRDDAPMDGLIDALLSGPR
jgi:hypothetical protein